MNFTVEDPYTEYITGDCRDILRQRSSHFGLAFCDPPFIDDEASPHSDNTGYKQWVVSWLSVLLQKCDRVWINNSLRGMHLIREAAYAARAHVIADVYHHFRFGEYKQKSTDWEANGILLSQDVGTGIHPNFFGEFPDDRAESRWPLRQYTEYVSLILKYVKPRSVLDPFCGRGVVADVCRLYGVPSVNIDIAEDCIIACKAKYQ